MTNFIHCLLQVGLISMLLAGGGLGIKKPRINKLTQGFLILSVGFYELRSNLISFILHHDLHVYVRFQLITFYEYEC